VIEGDVEHMLLRWMATVGTCVLRRAIMLRALTTDCTQDDEWRGREDKSSQRQPWRQTHKRQLEAAVHTRRCW
jgi:hypothetical protein